MKTQKPKLNLLKVLGVSFALVAAVYVIVQLYLIFGQDSKSEIAILYEMSDSVTLDGVVVFGEKEVPGSGSLGYLVEDGTRVVESTQVAEIYTDSHQAAWREELTHVDQEITLLEKAQNANSGSDIEVMSRQAKTNLYNLLDAMDRTQLSGVRAAKSDYLLAENRLSICVGEETDFTQRITQLKEERDALAGLLGQPQPVCAGSGGYFVSAANSKFLMYTEEELSQASPAQLSQLLNQGVQEQRSVAGKVITSYHWKYYTVCDLAAAEKFQNQKNVTISFPGKSEEELPAAVESVTVDQDGGLAKVVLSCEYTNAEILKLVQRPAQISFATYKGLRLNKEALHIVNGEKGVYIKYGTIQKFRKIYVLYENEDYILVPADQSEGSEVKQFDDVIIEGTDLKDGNLL